MWMEGIYWCRVVPTTMWAKITHKTSCFKNVGFFVSLELLRLGGGLMSCPNLVAKFRIQYISHMTPHFWWFYGFIFSIP